MKKVNTLLVAGLVAIFMLIFGSSYLLGSIRGSVQSLIAPISRPFYRSINKNSTVFSTISQIRNLSSENNALKKENISLKAQVVSLKEIEIKNKALEKEFKLGFNNKNQTSVAATIIGRSPATQRDILTIDKGSLDGIKKKQAVLSDGFLIGEVSQVSKNTSQIELVTSARFITPVILQDSRQVGLLKGGLKGLVIEQLPNSDEIKPGEGVVTSGLVGDLAEGIPIGKVGRTISQASDIFKSVLVDTPVDISRLEIVIVLEQK